MSPARAKDTSKKTGSLLFGREPVFYALMSHFVGDFKAFA